MAQGQNCGLNVENSGFIHIDQIVTLLKCGRYEMFKYSKMFSNQIPD